MEPGVNNCLKTQNDSLLRVFNKCIQDLFSSQYFCRHFSQEASKYFKN